MGYEFPVMAVDLLVCITSAHFLVSVSLISCTLSFLVSVRAVFCTGLYVYVCVWYVCAHVCIHVYTVHLFISECERK